MCYDYEFEVLARRAEEELKKIRERKEPQAPAPVEVPEEKPVPA